MSTSPRIPMNARFIFIRHGLLTKSWVLAIGILSGSLALPGTVAAQTWTPTAAGSYSWSLSTNWNPATVPNSTTAAAVLGSATTGNQTITLDGAITVNQLTFGDSGT